MGNFGRDKSYSRMVIYLKTGGKAIVWLSLENEDKVSPEKGMKGLVRRTLYKHFKDKYITAILIENKTGKWLHKWVNGIKEF